MPANDINTSRPFSCRLDRALPGFRFAGYPSSPSLSISRLYEGPNTIITIYLAYQGRDRAEAKDIVGCASERGIRSTQTAMRPATLPRAFPLLEIKNLQGRDLTAAKSPSNSRLKHARRSNDVPRRLIHTLTHSEKSTGSS